MTTKQPAPEVPGNGERKYIFEVVIRVLAMVLIGALTVIASSLRTDIKGMKSDLKSISHRLGGIDLNANAIQHNKEGIARLEGRLVRAQD